MRHALVLPMLTAVGLMACGHDGAYTGTATTHQGTSKDETQELVRLLKSSDTNANLYVKADGLPCGDLPLTGSGSSYKLKKTVDCQTTEQVGIGTPSTRSRTVTDVDVSITGNSMTIHAKYSYRSAGTTTSADYTYDFDGKRAATN